MKKLATLLLAAGMVLGSFAGAQAIDWKVRGAWSIEFGVYDGLHFTKDTVNSQRGPKKLNQAGAGDGGDTFKSGQRIDLWLDAVASENLSGSLRLEIGGWTWGQYTGTSGARSAGGAMGQRAVSIGVREAYIDWFVPSTELKFRMGLHTITNPSFTGTSTVIAENMTGVTASYKFNDNVSLAAFWGRPYNDNFNFGSNNANSGYMDNIDIFGLVLPLSFDGVKVTPWGAVAGVGPNSLAAPTNANAGALGAAVYGSDRMPLMMAGMTPAYAGAGNPRFPNSYGTAWWLGLTGDITALDPFRFAWDFNYGGMSWDSSKGSSFMNRQGWLINLLAEYKFDWGVPGLIFWYGSGDDSNPKNGSEQMPVFEIWNPDSAISNFGFNGSPVGALNEGILGTNFQTGTWGLGLRIRDMSFIEDLKHTLRVNFFGGTNDPQMAKYILGKKQLNGVAAWNVQKDFNRVGAPNVGGAVTPNTGNGLYLTRQDYGVEVNIDTIYKIYDNLSMIVELGYIHLWLDQSKAVWGPKAGSNATRGLNLTDAMKASVYFRYQF